MSFNKQMFMIMLMVSSLTFTHDIDLEMSTSNDMVNFKADQKAQELAAQEANKSYYVKTSDYVAAQYNTAKNYVTNGYKKTVACVKDGYVTTQNATVNAFNKSVEAVKAHPYITAGSVTAVVVAGAAYAYSQYAYNDEQN